MNIKTKIHNNIKEHLDYQIKTVIENTHPTSRIDFKELYKTAFKSILESNQENFKHLTNLQDLESSQEWSFNDGLITKN